MPSTKIHKHICNWHSTLTKFLKSEGFQANRNDPCVYTSSNGTDIIFIIFWVDDILVVGKSDQVIKHVKGKLENRFKMDDRGELKWFLGIGFTRFRDRSYQMSQERYTDEVLERFNMTDCKPNGTPADKQSTLMKAIDDEHLQVLNQGFPYRQAVGSLMYLMTDIRPDLSWILSKLSQFLDKPGPQHVTAIKRVFRYPKATRRSRLTFKPSDGMLSGYCDSDWAGDADDRRSTTGDVFKLGKDTAPISWKSRKQPTVALSSCEAEYLALSHAVKELLYLRSFCDQMNMSQPESSILYTNNQGALAMTKWNTSSHTRTKYKNVR